MLQFLNDDKNLLLNEMGQQYQYKHREFQQVSELVQAFEINLAHELIKLYEERSQQPGQRDKMQHKRMLIEFYQREQLTKIKPGRMYALESIFTMAGKTDSEIKAIATNLHAFVTSLIKLATKDLSTFKLACESISQNKADTIMSLRHDFDAELAEIDASRKRFLKSCTFDIDAFNQSMRTENLLRFLALIAGLGFLYLNINDRMSWAICTGIVTFISLLACAFSNSLKNGDMQSGEALIHLISGDSLFFVNEILTLNQRTNSSILASGHYGRRQQQDQIPHNTSAPSV